MYQLTSESILSMREMRSDITYNLLYACGAVSIQLEATKRGTVKNMVGHFNLGWYSRNSQRDRCMELNQLTLN